MSIKDIFPGARLLSEAPDLPHADTTQAIDGSFQRTLEIRLDGGQSDPGWRSVKIAFVFAPLGEIPNEEETDNPYCVVLYKVMEFRHDDDPPQSLTWTSDLGFNTYEEIDQKQVHISSKFIRVPSGHYVKLKPSNLGITNRWSTLKPFDQPLEMVYSTKSELSKRDDTIPPLVEALPPFRGRFWSRLKVPSLLGQASSSDARRSATQEDPMDLEGPIIIGSSTRTESPIRPHDPASRVAINQTKSAQNFVLGCVIGPDVHTEEVFCPMVLYGPVRNGSHVVGESHLMLLGYDISHIEGEMDPGPSNKGKSRTAQKGIRLSRARPILGPVYYGSLPEFSTLNLHQEGETVRLEATREIPDNLLPRHNEERRELLDPTRTYNASPLDHVPPWEPIPKTSVLFHGDQAATSAFRDPAPASPGLGSRDPSRRDTPSPISLSPTPSSQEDSSPPPLPKPLSRPFSPPPPILPPSPAPSSPPSLPATVIKPFISLTPPQPTSSPDPSPPPSLPASLPSPFAPLPSLHSQSSAEPSPSPSVRNGPLTDLEVLELTRDARKW